jgi:transposase
MQFETVLVARTPRVNCPEHGVKTIEVPWAGKNSRITLMFEAFAIRVLQACETVSSGAGLLRLDWHSAHQCFFNRWDSWAIRCRLAPVKDVARMLKAHLENLRTYFTYWISNALTEGFNSKIQSLKHQCTTNYAPHLWLPLVKHSEKPEKSAQCFFLKRLESVQKRQPKGSSKR